MDAANLRLAQDIRGRGIPRARVAGTVVFDNTTANAARTVRRCPASATVNLERHRRVASQPRHAGRAAGLFLLRLFLVLVADVAAELSGGRASTHRAQGGHLRFTPILCLRSLPTAWRLGRRS